MINPEPPNNHRLLELLADRALFGLDADEERELQGLLKTAPEIDSDSMDRAVASIDLARMPPHRGALPENLANRIRSDAARRFTGESRRPHSDVVPSKWSRPREFLAWLTAAASLLVAVYAWNARPAVGPRSATNSETSTVAKPESPSVPDTIAQQREQFLASAKDVIRLDLVSGARTESDPASGDIVWSSQQQMGYLRLRGLASNDPKESQYQLWIIETTPMRSDTVNGGVFDIAQPDREVILPIHADHFVEHPNVFAISIEPPGGSPDLTSAGYPLIARIDNLPR